MIKLFRHIRRSLINENKMGKYFKYAIGEIILVVIGILIALSINTWNEERNNIQKEISYLNSLVEEFNINKELTKEYIYFSQAQYNAAHYVSKSMSSDTLDVEAVTFIDALTRCSSLAHINYSKNVWEELKSTGDLSLINNKKLTQSISNYIKRLDYATNLEEEWGLTHLKYRNLTNEIIDFELKRKIVDARIKKGIISHSKLNESKGLVNNIQVKSMINQLKEIKGISGLLSDIYLNRKFSQLLYEQIDAETNKVQDLINKEIELLK